MMVGMNFYRATPASVVHIIVNSTTRTRCGTTVGVGAKFNASDLPSGERTFPICKRCRA